MPTGATPGQQVADEAEAVLNSVQHTTYTHDTYVDAATGTYDMDCSAYVGYVLLQVAPQQYGLIHNGGGTHGPLAVDFYRYLDALPPGGTGSWQPVQTLEEASRGDIVAWDLPDATPGDDTGHVFIVTSTPQVLSDGVLAVRVCDSSRVLHYDDTRRQGGGSPDTGLGSGVIRFQHTSSGLEFQFGPGDNYHSVPVAIGRIAPLPV